MIRFRGCRAVDVAILGLGMAAAAAAAPSPPSIAAALEPVAMPVGAASGWSAAPVAAAPTGLAR